MIICCQIADDMHDDVQGWKEMNSVPCIFWLCCSGVYAKLIYKIPNSRSGSHTDSSVQLTVKIW